MIKWNDTNNEYRPKDGTVCLVRIKTNEGYHAAYAVAVWSSDEEEKGFYVLTAVGIGVCVRTSVSQVAGFIEIEEESR